MHFSLSFRYRFSHCNRDGDYYTHIIIITPYYGRTEKCMRKMEAKDIKNRLSIDYKYDIKTIHNTSSSVFLISDYR